MLGCKSWGSQLIQWAKMKITIKSLFTYCDNISKRPKRKVVLALHCSSFPPAPPPTEWHWAEINHMTCSVDGGNSLTAEEHWAEDSCLFMNPGTGRGEKERLEVEKTEKRRISNQQYTLYTALCIIHICSSFLCSPSGFLLNCNLIYVFHFLDAVDSLLWTMSN